MPIAKRHVFLSYCHENKKQVARLRQALIDNGEPVFWDEDILAGQIIQQTIGAALRASYAFVLCMSEEAAARSRSGIFPEARDAVTALREYPPGSIFVIVARLSKCNIPPVPIDATTTLADLLYIDLFPPAEYDDGLARLLRAVRATPERP